MWFLLIFHILFLWLRLGGAVFFVDFWAEMSLPPLMIYYMIN